MQILNELNKRQLQAVQHTEGPLLLLAGAGSGKTRTIIHRAAYLIHEKKVNPDSLLIVTFTNKAAAELRNRLYGQFNIFARRLWVGTFHSVCARILRKENANFYFNSDFVIFDTVDQKSIVKNILKKNKIDPDKFGYSGMLSVISNMKTNLVQPEDFFEFNNRSLDSEITHKIYVEYQKQLELNNALDYDDLLMYTALLLHNYDNIAKIYRKKFSYIMIDEYQDTNYVQYKILEKLTNSDKNICAVGDEDQAIYSWRGATVKNMLNFHKDFSNATLIRLEQNYRSTTQILDLANDIIKNNDNRYDKVLWSSDSSGEKPIVFATENENEEVNRILNHMDDEIRENNRKLTDFVVLYRTNAQSRIFETELVKRSIPYQIVGGVNFYQRKEIKDIVSYLRVMINSENVADIRRVINVPPRGIGAKSLERIDTAAEATDRNFWQVLCEIETVERLRPATRNNIREFTDNIEKCRSFFEVNPLSEAIKKVMDTFKISLQYEKSNDIQDRAKYENLMEFLRASAEFEEQFEVDFQRKPDLRDFLQNITLMTDLDRVEDNAEKLRLMTLHNAKGMEFPVVYIAGVNEKLIPHVLNTESQEKTEEERRLFYVGVTRAKRTLVLTYSRFRRNFGKTEQSRQSRFLFEIDRDLLNWYENGSNTNSYTSRAKIPNMNIVLESEKFFKIGMKVRHKNFGDGVILNVEGKDKNAKLTISFKKGQLKRILGSYVELVK